MVSFGGWDMPVEYPATGGLIAEHLAVRTGVGLFDVSHMGDILIEAATPGGALAAVQHISMNDASKLAVGQAHYSALLYPGTREKDFHWVRDNVRGDACTARDVGDNFTQLAIQGPRAAEVLAKLTDADLGGIRNYWFTRGTVCGLADTLIARTGYTGEDGFEIYVPSDAQTSEMVWSRVLEAGKEFGILPCGLGARNTLRLESKMALYGHEISESINVWEAGLDRFCKMDKSDFIGRAALERSKAAGLRRTLVGLEMVERGIARDGYKVFDQAGREIGYVTSGSPAPFLKKNIALAYVPPEHAAIGSALLVEVRTQKLKAQVVPTPFYKRPKK